jgi:energy-coupling factor transporter ATP-binding protein EcfA2
MRMISSLTIEGYRCFDHFEMSGLGRVNLLVGKNNSGKTSVLEAIYLLMSEGEPLSMWHLLQNRGETYLFETPSSPATTQVGADANHLFPGHRIKVGSELILSAADGSTPRRLMFTVVGVPVNGANPAGRPSSGLALRIEGSPQPPFEMVALSSDGGISPQWLEVRPEPASFPLLIANDTQVKRLLLGLWDRVVLTPAEGVVLKALQFIDPDIERIAVQIGGKPYVTGLARGGFIVKRKGFDFPIPIGSMGDGMWHLLALAMSITQCRGTVLLVDEIDTGLHYSVMTQMWQLILSVAKEFDVQVFATTHSFDCVESLAYASAGLEDVTVQRIEAGKRKAIPYDREVLKVAAEHQIEVR